MTDPVTDPVAFWDSVHAGDDNLYRADTGAGSMRNHYGDQIDADKRAGPCLEIGPGRGIYLATMGLPRYVVEISPLNRRRLLDQGLCERAFDPGDEPEPLGCHFGLAHLVFQHCELDQVQRLLQWAHTALVPGGAFYCQTASMVKDAPTPGPVLQGGGARPESEWYALLRDAGFDVEEQRREGPWGRTMWSLWRCRKCLGSI